MSNCILSCLEANSQEVLHNSHERLISETKDSCCSGYQEQCRIAITSALYIEYYSYENVNPMNHKEMKRLLTSQHLRAKFVEHIEVENGHHFAESIFRCIFLNGNICIFIKISLKFAPKGPIDNNPAPVEIMAWPRIGDKPLSELMLTQFTGAYMWH